MPRGYLENSGIIDKQVEKQRLTVEIGQIIDQVASITQDTAGALDRVSAPNTDRLSIRSGGGVDTTARIVADYSNGRDADREGRRSRHPRGQAGQPPRAVGLA